MQLSPAQDARLTTASVANAGATSKISAGGPAVQRPGFSQVMHDALAATPQRQNARPSSSQLRSSALEAKAASTQSDRKAQSPRDSAGDPTTTNPITKALADIPLQPVTAPLSLAANFASGAAPGNEAQLPPTVSPNARSIALPQNPTELPGSPNLTVPLSPTRIIGTSFAQTDQLTVARSLAPAASSSPTATSQTANLSADAHTRSTASTVAASKCITADSTGVIATTTPAPPIDGAEVAKSKAGSGAVDQSAGLEKVTSSKASPPSSQNLATIPMVAPESAAANAKPSPEQTVAWKEVAKTTVATPPLPLASPVTLAKATPPDAQNLPLASATPQAAKALTATHSNYPDSSGYQNDSRANDAQSATKSAASSTPSHDAQQFSASLTSSLQSSSGVAQATPLATATVTNSAPVLDRSAAPTTLPPDTSAPTSRLPLTAFPADSASGKFVTSAQLLATSGHSEMRISLDTDKLGSIELRARLTGDQVGASIVVEKREAHAALAVELPALQQALSDKQLRVDNVALLHGSFSATTGDPGSSTNQNQPNAPRNAYPSVSPEGNLSVPLALVSAQAAIFDSQGHLSVHA